MNPIRALLQFTTVLPFGQPADFDAFARHSYLYPIAGYLIGGITAAAVFFIPYSSIAAAAAIALVLLLSGCNHFDGLVDLGDGLMAHGSREKRIRALTDRQVGAGGIAMALIVMLLTYAGLTGVTSIPVAILVAEVLAKTAMAILTAVGEPFREGMHSYLHGFTRRWFAPAAVALCMPLILLPAAPMGLALSFIAMLAVTGVMVVTGNRLFGGVNGDIVGASNELTRMAAILVLALIS
jgi:adenosylcobinamide-GDP ribazoletransferase